MRQFMTHLLCLTLTICCLFSFGMAEDTSAQAVQLKSVNSLFLVEDTLYACSWEGLFRFDENGENPTALSLGEQGVYPSRGTAWGTTVYLLDNANVLYRATLSGDTVSTPEALAELPGVNGEDGWSSCIGLVADDSAAWVLLAVSDMNSVTSRNTLYRVDLADGTVQEVKAEHLTSLCAYKEGQLLARQWDMDAMFRAGSTELPALVVIDKATLAATPWGSLPDEDFNATVYDATNDILYAASSNKLVRLDASLTPTTCAQLSLPYTQDGMQLLLWGERCLIPSDDEACGYIAANTDPALMPDRTLRIAATYMDENTRAFCKEHPEIAVELVDTGAFGAEQIAQSMIAGSDAADVYSVYPNYTSFSQLRDKGYCVNLSDSAILTDAVGRMYPHLTACCYDSEGRLFALPRTLYGSAPGYSPSAMQRLGLTEEDMPRTYAEYMDFLVRWLDELADNSENLTLFNDSHAIYDIRQQLLTMIQEAYLANAQVLGEPLTFNTPQFRALLSKLDEVSPTLIQMNPETVDNSGYVITFYDEATSLMNLETGIALRAYDYADYTLLPLALDETSQPAYSVTMEVLVANPNSANVDLAMTYLEYMAEHLEPQFAILLYPDHNDPIEQTYYQSNLQLSQDYLDQLRNQLEEADDADKPSLEDMIADQESVIARMEKARWAVSPEKIASWRERATSVVVLAENPLRDDSVSDLSRRYIDGQISADQYITELERLLNMIRMEAA